MNWIVLWFVKITGLIPELFFFRRKTYYVNKKNQNRKIKGAAIIVSNHKSLLDYPLYMYTFFTRSLRTLTAEVIYKKGKLMAWFIKKIGCIRVDRDEYEFGFMGKTIEILDKGGVALVFPEGKLPDDSNMLDFKPSFVYMALETKSPIIPVWTNGKYMKKERAKVVIGEKIYLHEMYDETKSEKENLNYLSNYVRDYICSLGDVLNEKKQKSS